VFRGNPHYKDPERLARIATCDLAALSSLLTQHVNQYVRLQLALETRIPVDEAGQDKP